MSLCEIFTAVRPSRDGKCRALKAVCGIDSVIADAVAKDGTRWCLSPGGDARP